MFGPFGSGDLRVAACDGQAGRGAFGRISTVACLCALVLLSSATTVARAKASGAEPVVRAVGTQLMLGKQPFYVYGFNYEFNGVHPNLDYIDKPTQANLHGCARTSPRAARLGASTVRIFLELHDFVSTPTDRRDREHSSMRCGRFCRKRPSA